MTHARCGDFCSSSRFNLYTAVRLNATNASPLRTSFALFTTSLDTSSGDNRSYSFTTNKSPVDFTTRLTNGTALGSPHRCNSSAGNPNNARVYAYPLCGSLNN